MSEAETRIKFTAEQVSQMKDVAASIGVSFESFIMKCAWHKRWPEAPTWAGPELERTKEWHPLDESN